MDSREDPQTNSPLKKLPPSLLKYITRNWLDKNTVNQLSQTCRLFNRISNEVFIEQDRKKNLRDLAVARSRIDYRILLFNKTLKTGQNKPVDKIKYVGNNLFAVICDYNIFHTFSCDRSHDITFIDGRTKQIAFTIKDAHEKSIYNIVNLGGGFCASNTDEEIKIWNLKEKGRCQQRILRQYYNSSIHFLTYLGKQTLMYAEIPHNGNEMYVVLLSNDNPSKHWKMHPFSTQLKIKQIKSLGYPYVALVHENKENNIIIFNVENQENQIVLSGHSNNGLHVDVIKIDDVHLMSYYMCGMLEIKIWNIFNAQCERTFNLYGHNQGIQNILYLGHNKIAVLSNFPTDIIQTWNIMTGTVEHSYNFKTIHLDLGFVRRIINLENGVIAAYCYQHTDNSSSIVIIDTRCAELDDAVVLKIPHTFISKLLSLPEGELFLGDEEDQIHFLTFAKQDTSIQEQIKKIQEQLNEYNTHSVTGNCTLF